MYKDIISYELADGVSQEYLLKVAKRVVSEWMQKQKGFEKWEILVNKDGSYTDIVYWESQEDAKNSEKEMANIPNAAEWYSCYKSGSIKSKNLNSVATFN